MSRPLYASRPPSQGHSALGVVYAKTGRLADAVHENQRVLALAPNNLASHSNLALLYRNLGKRQQALGHALQALKVAPAQQRAALERLIARLRQ